MEGKRVRGEEVDDVQEGEKTVSIATVETGRKGK